LKNTKIDWADDTMNFFTGCYHDCPYCYARDMANRFKTKGEMVEPETYRLEYNGKEIIECNEQPFVIKRTGKRIRQAYPYGFTPCYNRFRYEDFNKIEPYRNVFMGSMTDMWGDWVPDRWLIEVLAACQKKADINYLFLTKNPKRYLEFYERGELPTGDQFWYGTTVTNPRMLFMHSKVCHTFLSIEPILEDFGDFGGGEFVEWVIIGAETGKRKEKVIPKREWIENLVNICRKRNVPVFMKESLTEIWGEELIREYPKELRR